jgi:hypothetical protein
MKESQRNTSINSSLGLSPLQEIENCRYALKSSASRLKLSRNVQKNGILSLRPALRFLA